MRSLDKTLCGFKHRMSLKIRGYTTPVYVYVYGVHIERTEFSKSAERSAQGNQRKNVVENKDRKSVVEYCRQACVREDIKDCIARNCDFSSAHTHTIHTVRHFPFGIFSRLVSARAAPTEDVANVFADPSGG